MLEMTLEILAQNQNAEPAEYRGLSSFMKHDSHKFEGNFDPEGAQRWIADTEKILMLWAAVRSIRWVMQPICYAEKQTTGGEEDLCAQFENGLRVDIHTAVSVFQVIDLPTLVSKCWVYEENARGKSVDTRVGGPMRQDRRPSRFQRRSYSGPAQSRASRVTTRREGGSNSNVSQEPLKCFRCGGPHMIRNCLQLTTACGHCEKMGHPTDACWFAPQESRSVSGSNRLAPNSSGGSQSNVQGRVFAMTGSEATKSDDLI
ncbi:uncharacterized protein LOC113862368 [Abrus precatorius]|uniref:Uncharacterized protein LOC113862368 n=1 Tax=Abrus precatorius TaxID=3816 RepID=A0A8B8L7B8_ABRPR|nr:uncharacterized protein LOC113862368 [Abrus precatorius]